MCCVMWQHSSCLEVNNELCGIKLPLLNHISNSQKGPSSELLSNVLSDPVSSSCLILSIFFGVFIVFITIWIYRTCWLSECLFLITISGVKRSICRAFGSLNMLTCTVMVVNLICAVAAFATCIFWACSRSKVSNIPALVERALTSLVSWYVV